MLEVGQFADRDGNLLLLWLFSIYLFGRLLDLEPTQSVVYLLTSISQLSYIGKPFCKRCYAANFKPQGFGFGSLGGYTGVGAGGKRISFPCVLDVVIMTSLIVSYGSSFLFSNFLYFLVSKRRGCCDFDYESLWSCPEALTKQMFFLFDQKKNKNWNRNLFNIE